MITEQLQQLLPGYEGIANLAERASEINQALAQGQITPEEHHALIDDLARTELILNLANEQEKRIFFDQVIDVLKMIPLP